MAQKLKNPVADKLYSPDAQKSMQNNPKAGENAKYVFHELQMWNWPDIDLTDDEVVEQRVLDYFGICAQNDVKPSIAGFALALNASRKDVQKWANGGRNVSPVLARAVQVLNALIEDYTQNGKINPVPALFLMKNNFGYSDQQEIIVAAKQEEEVTAEELQKKYIDSVATVMDEPVEIELPVTTE